MHRSRTARRRNAIPRARFLLLALTLTSVTVRSADETLPTAKPRFDPAAVVGPAKCSECHEPETGIWKASAHVTGGKALTRSDAAKQMATALGIRRIKSDERCMECHFTPQSPQSQDAGKTVAVSEVSCESCHGPARDWMDVHNDFGAEGATRQSEAPDHREQRQAACDRLGMVRPGRLLSLAARCFDCHLIADEALVDRAGHPASDALELVAASQGAMRHNFIRGAGSNASSDAPRLRLMFVIGHGVRLEASLRALAGATHPGPFVDQHAASIERAREALTAAAALGRWPSLDALLRATDGITLQSGQGEQLRAAADLARSALEEFVASHDGSALQALDALIPAPMADSG